MCLKNPLLDSALRSLRVAGLALGFAASGCIVAPLDEITPSASKPSKVERMDAGSDAAQADASGSEPRDAGSSEITDTGSPESDAAAPVERPTGGRGGAGGRAGSSGSAAGAGGSAGAAGSGGRAGAAGSETMMPEGPEEIEAANQLFFDRINQRNDVRCACIADPTERAVCAGYKPRQPHVDCFNAAYQRLGPNTIDALECAAEVELQWHQCYAQAACTEDNFVACNDTNIVERTNCGLPSDVFINRCLSIYDAITAPNGFMQRASEFVDHVCRCNPDGTIDPSTVCQETWFAETSNKTVDCVADNVYELEARSLDQATSPAVTLLQCVSDALAFYGQCMNELGASCDPAAQEQCSDEFTTLVTDACGAQGISLFSCITAM